MLDVHPPHSPAHTWKDFFIHIATIVIGLMIAVGLEQTVEAIHRNHVRHQLMEDLRAEAERRVPRIEANIQRDVAAFVWERGLLRAALAAQPVGGSVTFRVPVREPGHMRKPETAVWSAAKASGVLGVLSRTEIETWSRVDYDAEGGELGHSREAEAQIALDAVAERLGVSLDPGSEVRVTASGRDELAVALGVLITRERDFAFREATLEGSTKAALDGVTTSDAMIPYVNEAGKAVPQ
jgi:hypothetical protein